MLTPAVLSAAIEDALEPTACVSRRFRSPRSRWSGVFTLRKYLAALDPGDGSATRWDPSPDDVVKGLAVSPDGSRLFVGGDFLRISGGRRDLAEFDLTNGLLTGWRPIAPFFANTVALSGDGSTLYAAGEGAFFVYRGG
jgi:hypothetical protein